MDAWADVVKELLVFATAVFAAWAAKNAKGARKDMKTNHGKRPGEYLEMVAKVHEQNLLNAARLRLLSRELHNHTAQDAVQFESMNEQLTKVTEFVDYQHDRNHDIINAELANEGRIARLRNDLGLNPFPENEEQPNGD